MFHSLKIFISFLMMGDGSLFLMTHIIRRTWTTLEPKSSMSVGMHEDPPKRSSLTQISQYTPPEHRPRVSPIQRVLRSAEGIPKAAPVGASSLFHGSGCRDACARDQESRFCEEPKKEYQLCLIHLEKCFEVTYAVPVATSITSIPGFSGMEGWT